MTWPYEASVVHRNGHDYWRTWFIEECESAQLFGLTEKHLALVTVTGVGCPAYEAGTEIFLEDAPYFRASKTHHRVCGPYEVVPIILPEEATPIYKDSKENLIVYKEANPKNGPWKDLSSVTRSIDGLKIHFPQIASQFNYYPYRFGIKRSKRFKIELVRHKEHCWLCVNVRRRRW